MILGAELVTLRRHGAYTTDASGNRVRGSSSDTTISVSWQPLNGDDWQALPEGERHVETRKGYTTTAVRVEDQHTGVPADELVVDGVTYKVVRVERERAVLSHYKLLATRVQEAV